MQSDRDAPQLQAIGEYVPHFPRALFLPNSMKKKREIEDGLKKKKETRSDRTAAPRRK